MQTGACVPVRAGTDGRTAGRIVCNRRVADMGPGKVEVHEIDYPKLELREGPGVNPIVADLVESRLAQAKCFGCETVDVSKGSPQDQVEQILGVPAVDAAVDAVGFEARGHGRELPSGPRPPCSTRSWSSPPPAARSASPASTSPVTPAASTRRQGGLAVLSLGTGWAKSLLFTTGQCPVMRSNYGLIKAILHDKVQIAKAVNATVIPLDEAPQGYADFDQGAAKKYVIDPHGMVA